MEPNESRQRFEDVLRRIQDDAESARIILRGALEPDSGYTTLQVNAAQKVMTNALIASDRLNIYGKLAEMEAILGEIVPPSR